jgi:hypothetical protein
MGDRTGSHDEFAFQFVVGLCTRHGKAHGEKGARRGYQGSDSMRSIHNVYALPAALPIQSASGGASQVGRFAWPSCSSWVAFILIRSSGRFLIQPHWVWLSPRDSAADGRVRGARLKCVFPFATSHKNVRARDHACFQRSEGNSHCELELSGA